MQEAGAPAVDRELSWVLNDWRLDGEAAIARDFGGSCDLGHGGRLGNLATINHRVPDGIAVRSGERIRLRLINAPNARIFEFEGHAPRVIALDRHPVTPHAPEGGLVVLNPAMRADIILEIGSAPGARASLVDLAYGDDAYRLVDLGPWAGAPARRAR